MALVTDKCVFLHIPKCSGQWIRHIFKICQIKSQEIGDQHSHFPDLYRFKPESFFANKFWFAFVRHPLTWYQSRWAFRVKHGWKPQHPLDFNCMSNDFRTFVDNALRYKPDGWFTWECRSFIDQCDRPIDFVGRTEYVVDDVIKALKLSGEKHDEHLIRSCPRINDSDMDGKSSKHWAKYDLMTANRVLAVDQEIINRYYNGFKLDLDALCGPDPY